MSYLVFSFLIFISFSSFGSAKTLIVADFDNGSDPLTINSSSRIDEDSGNVSHSYVATNSHGNRGKCLQINHSVQGAGWLLLNFVNSIDITTNSATGDSYTALSFWARGGSAGQFFAVDIKRQTSGEEPSGELRFRIKDILPNGLSTSWQKIVIPIKALTKGISLNGYQDVVGITFDFVQDNAGAGVIYIDDVVFSSKTAPVIIDNFEDVKDPTALREYSTNDHDGSGVTYSTGIYISTESYSGTKSFQLNYENGATGSWGSTINFYLQDKSVGGKFVDIGPAATNRLYFAMKKEAGTNAPNLSIDFWDANSNLAAMNINSYVPVTDSWQVYSIPLAAFSGVDLSKMDRIAFTFPTANDNAKVYIDDFKIIDSSAPTIPSALKVSNVSISSGMVICSTDVLTVTADAGNVDSTLERVRFEHDNFSGGASWTTIGVDTNSTDNSYSAIWQDYINMSLFLGNTCQIRAVIEDVAGNESYSGVYNNIKLRPNAPKLVDFQVFTTSISVTLNPRGNPVGTTLSVSTGSFELSTTSSVICGAGDTVIVLSGITPNAASSVNARAYAQVESSVTVVTASTATLPAVPINLSVTGVNTSSITVQWTSNGNPLTPPTSYEMLISSVSDFSLYSASVTFNNWASTDSLVINTTYYFKVRTFGVGGSASNYTSYLTTVTLSNVPVLSGFQVFSTSISVTLGANSNVAGTTFVVSTMSYASNISSSGASGAGDTTLVIKNLTPNSTYQINTGAINFSGQYSSGSLIIPSTTTLPAVPISLTFASVNFSSITVSWSNNGNPLTPPTSYQVQVATSSDFGGTVTSSFTFLTQASTIGLTANNYYYFRILSFGIGGSSSPFTSVVSTVTPSYSPGVVSYQIFTTSVSVTLASNGNAAGTTLSVTTGSFETSSSSSGVIGSGGGNVTLIISSLTANKSYVIQTRSLNFSTVPSSHTTVASTATLPAVPGVMTFSLVGHNSISISWDNNGNPLTSATSYQVQVSSAQDSSFASYTTSNTYSLTFSTIQLSPATTYFFRIFTYGVGGTNSGYNSVVSTITTLSPSSAPAAPSALTVTSIGTGTIALDWVDNSNNEDGFKIYNSSSGVLYGTAPINALSFSVNNLSFNTLVYAQIIAFNSSGASTSTAVISSYTLVNPPTVLALNSVGIGNATIMWSTNSNPSTVVYEVTQSTNNFSTVFSTPVPFSSAFTSNVVNIPGLTTGVTYYFKVQAQNGNGIKTAFSSVISTATGLLETITSTGGIKDVGGVTMSADPGVSIVIELLSNGTTEQTFLSTQTANVSYSNGVSLQLPAGVEATVIVSAVSVQMTSTQTVPITNSGLTVEATSGTVTVQPSATTLEVYISSTAPQDMQMVIISTTDKIIGITLNPPSGAIRTTLMPGTLSDPVRLRARLPSAYPSAAALRPASFNRASPLLESAAYSGTPSVFTSFGIGLEITLDKSIQPKKTVVISMKYRDSDVANTNSDTLVVGRYEDSVQKWLPITTSLDKSGKTAIGLTKHFSKFQLMALSPATDVSGAKIFPNPLQMHKGQSEMTFTNLTANASIKIYTYRGELVRRLYADATGISRWDAKNSFGELVGSGIYMVMIEGENNSEKTVKVAVEK